ncbi:hypothetical protein GT016_32640 [Streptomyces sp. SID3915]|nr:hypothetical protein [Streptomyces sp. SID3915]
MAITGSLASDHLMVFPGRFADQLLPGSLERVSLSFLADHLEVRRGTPVGVPAAPTDHVVDPTGAGDAFRAGFLAGVARGRSQVRAAQLGCVVATTVLESVGAQEYKIVAADVAGRAARAYGPEVAGELESILAATG